MRPSITFLAVVSSVVLSLSDAAIAQAPRGGQAPRGRGTPEAPARGAVALTPARISDALVAELLKLGASASTYRFLGIYKHDGDTTMLQVTSARSLIAFSQASAVGKGGKYNPPASARADLVSIDCGDEDLGERFDCARVAVTINGKRTTPVAYSAGPRTYRNALGATWTARKVTATYRAQDLVNGFVITFAEPDGTEYELAVSADDAADELLLALRTDGTGLRPSPGPPPPQLRMEFARNGDGWRVTNLDDYRWPNCVAWIGPSEMKIGAIDPKGAIILSQSDFRPPLPANSLEDATLYVTCTIGTNQFTASGRVQ